MNIQFLIIITLTIMVFNMLIKELGDAYRAKKNYDKGFQDGVKRAFLPFKEANRKLNDTYKEMPNGDLYITISLDKTK